MKKSDIKQGPSYFDRYINLVDDIELSEALKQSVTELDTLDFEAFNKLADYAYAEGKWTIKDIFQHLIDTERIMCYRALCFARGEKAQLPGFDEDGYAQHALASTKKRSLRSLINEFKLVHRATIALFKSFDKAALQRKSIMYNSEMSVLGVGFVLAGHQKHHFKVIQERYLPHLKA